MPGRKDERETYRPPSLQPLSFFLPFFMNRWRRQLISQFISGEPEPFHFLAFSVKIYSSPHSGPDDVLSASYTCVIERALWKGRARSVAKSSLALLHQYERKCLHNPQRSANAKKSTSSSIVPVVPKGPPGQDMPYLNRESLSVKFRPINSMAVPQTVNCQAISSLSSPSVSPSLL